MRSMQPDDAQTEPLVQVHNRPKKYLEEWLDVPAHVHHVSHRMMNPPIDRPRSREEFRHVLASLEFPDSSVVLSEKFGYGVRIEANGDRIVLAWEAHTEYYSYQVWHIPDDKTLPLEFGPLTVPHYRFPLCSLGTRVNALDIIISPEAHASPEYLRGLMPGPHIYGSRVFGEDISVIASFTPDEQFRERNYIFSASPTALLRHVAKVVDGIVTIENYYHLVLLPFPSFSQAVDRAHEFEQRHLRQRERITADLGSSTSTTLQEWVTQLTQDFMEVSRFAEAMRYQLSASVPYDAIIHSTLKGLQEAPFPPFLPLSEYILAGTSGVADGYQQLIRRIDAMEKDFEGMISVIRARVDLMLQEQNLVQQDQNFKLLQSVDQTTKSQAILQRTVEGLSVIVIAYYLSGLASYVFKGFHHLGWLSNAEVPTGIFAVASLGVSFALIVIGRKVINARMGPSSKTKGSRT